MIELSSMSLFSDKIVLSFPIRNKKKIKMKYNKIKTNLCNKKGRKEVSDRKPLTLLSDCEEANSLSLDVNFSLKTVLRQKHI